MTQEQFAGPDEPNSERSTRDHSRSAVDSLKKAMRRARQDNAERAAVLDELRSMRIGRLEILREALRPLIAQIPEDVDTFDVGLMPGATPRLFIDMIGFVEMGRDARVYCLMQDSRHGRTRLAESEDIGTMVDAVTDYVARRLLERDKALAADTARYGSDGERLSEQRVSARTARTPQPVAGPLSGARRREGPLRWLAIAFAFLIDLLGAIAFFTIIAVVGWYVWNRMHTPM